MILLLLVAFIFGGFAGLFSCIAYWIVGIIGWTLYFAYPGIVENFREKKNSSATRKP